jgi:hypothetical protein
MEFEHTYPPYASYALLRLFIYLKKRGKTNTVEYIVAKSVVLHTVKPSYPKSSFSVIAAAIPAGLPRPQNESSTITVKVTGRDR